MEEMQIIEEKLEYKTLECEKLKTKLQDLSQQNIVFVQNV